MRSHEIEFQQIVCMYPWTAQALTICELFQSTTPLLLYWQSFNCQNSLYSLSKILNIPRHCWDLISILSIFYTSQHRRWVFGQATPTLETAWMFETDFARPRRKMAVGRSISSEKSWLFCQMRPVKTACQVAHCFHACKSTWQGVKTAIELIQDGKWKNWISANFYIRVMKLVSSGSIESHVIYTML